MNNYTLTNIKTFETKDYSIFKQVEGNRSINLKNVNSIISNIKKNGLLPSIIIVNEKLEVIDGQHRLEAFKTLNLPIRYQIYRGLTVKDCVAYNISSMKWEMKDFVESYAKMGNEEYKKLWKLIEEFNDLTLTTIVSVAKGCGYTVNKTNEIQEGRFKFKRDLNDVVNKLKFLEAVKPSIVCLAGYKSLLLVVIANLLDLKSIDEDRLKEQLIKYGDDIQSIANTKDALEKLESIYSKRKKAKLYFVSEYKRRYEE